jgi:hypothetical protein
MESAIKAMRLNPIIRKGATLVRGIKINVVRTASILTKCICICYQVMQSIQSHGRACFKKNVQLATRGGKLSIGVGNGSTTTCAELSALFVRKAARWFADE